MIVERVEALEAKFEDLQTGTLHRNETSVNNPDPSSSGSKDKEGFLEENAEWQRKDPTPFPRVNTRATYSFERPQATLLDMVHELVQQNQYERHDSYDVAGYITKKVRLEVLDFAGKIDYHYVDWLASWDGYFAMYDVSDERRVKFAIIKLVGQALICWRNVGNDCQLAEQPPIVMWDYMKQKIKRKYQPCDYEDELFHQLTNLRHGEHVSS
jgi:hypothetical protein